jgi:hypothetical protein
MHMDIALGTFAFLIKDHWQRSRPTMYAAFERDGTLEERVADADRLTRTTLAQLLDHGMSWSRAWDLARREWMLFPADSRPIDQDLGAEPPYRQRMPRGAAHSILTAATIS